VRRRTDDATTVVSVPMVNRPARSCARFEKGGVVSLQGSAFSMCPVSISRLGQFFTFDSCLNQASATLGSVSVSINFRSSSRRHSLQRAMANTILFVLPVHRGPRF
jgi:hypothetical protein